MTTTSSTTTSSCIFKTPYSGSVPLCEDGATAWDCVGENHGQRMQCPATLPMMCASKTCGSSKRNYCCEPDCAALGGPRPCLPPTTTADMTSAPTTTADMRSAPTTMTTTSSCIWNTPYKGSLPLCEDGASTWDCVGKNHGQRMQCPETLPVMCASATCGTSKQNWCCEPSEQACAVLGGPRPCIPMTTTTKNMTAGGCEWKSNQHPNDRPLCEDGAESWTCVEEGHGQRIQCPKEFPVMCNEKNCGRGKDYCCERECFDMGGERPCLGGP